MKKYRSQNRTRRRTRDPIAPPTITAPEAAASNIATAVQPEEELTLAGTRNSAPEESIDGTRLPQEDDDTAIAELLLTLKEKK